MPLPDQVRDLANRILVRLDEARDFYLHTRQAWRLVQQIAHEGRSVGIVDMATAQEVPATDLEPLAQRYVTVHLSESTFKSLSALLEDWMVGMARLWLTAYPIQLDAAYNEAADRSRSHRREEIQVPLSHILAVPDRTAILGGVVERVVRELAYRRPAQWFRFLDNRVNLGCPDENQRGALCELKAARDASPIQSVKANLISGLRRETRVENGRKVQDRAVGASMPPWPLRHHRWPGHGGSPRREDRRTTDRGEWTSPTPHNPAARPQKRDCTRRPLSLPAITPHTRYRPFPQR